MLERFEKRFMEIMLSGGNRKRLDMLLYDMGEVYQIYNRFDEMDPEVMELYRKIQEAKGDRL